MRQLLACLCCGWLLLPMTSAASSCLYAVDIYFPPGIAALTAIQKEQLLAEVERAEKYSKILSMMAYGAADPSDLVPATQAEDLSIRRARSVQDFLLRVRPELTPLTGSEGTGWKYPVAPVGDARNRRVELHIGCPTHWRPWEPK